MSQLNIKDIQTSVAKHLPRFTDELIELLKIPSVSADSKYSEAMTQAAEAVAGYLKSAGAENVEICPTGGHPSVYGEKIVSPDQPTVLVYGHYDVQPPDPIELWESGPFEPVIKKTEIHPEGAIFARGACDDKGQMFMHIKALEILNEFNEYPCNLKFLIEGEEEVGSENLESFLIENKDRLKCDAVLVCDTAIGSLENPCITTGIRGLSYIEVEITGPNRDLHSGVYGGAVTNPIQVLGDLIAGMRDNKGKILIPGFYDGILEVEQRERDLMRKIPFSEEDYKNHLDVKELGGESEFTPGERTGIRPCIDVNGIWGGYTGEGAKTVLPSKAYAKLSARLVPGQDYKRITELLKTYFETQAPDSVTVKVTPHHGGKPYVTPISSVEYQAAEKAIEESFGIQPLPYRSGGSIPITSLFEDVLGVRTVLMGFGLDSDALHSPNEHYGLVNYRKGIETIPLFYKYYQEMKRT